MPGASRPLSPYWIYRWQITMWLSSLHRITGLMLSLGATAFDKGCYPGQEVVARVHNLGDVKRRAHRYSMTATPPAIASGPSAAA